MPKMHINKSTVINASVEKVFNTLNDFHHWQAWSPWLIMDPGAQVNVASDGKSYDWSGKVVGAGNMQVSKEEANKSIDYALNFTKPMKSKATVRFEVAPEGEGTKVTWLMDSSLPFFLFFLKKLFTALIGADYSRGLNLLKDLVEDGKVHSKLDFQGVSEYPGCKFIGIRRQINISQMGEGMDEIYARLSDAMKDHPNGVRGFGMAIYHKWDMVNGKVDYTYGAPVEEIPANLPEGVIGGTIPKVKVYTIQHTGPYHHMANVWSTMMNMARAKEGGFKQNKAIDPFEVYHNVPGMVEDEELLTDVVFAVK